MDALTEHIAGFNAVCELANLTRGELQEFPGVVSCSVEELLEATERATHRLRHEHLEFANLSWELANALRYLRADLLKQPQGKASMDDLRAHLRDVALVLQKQGYSSDVLVALLAAGHAAEDARDARDVLDL